MCWFVTCVVLVPCRAVVLWCCGTVVLCFVPLAVSLQPLLFRVSSSILKASALSLSPLPLVGAARRGGGQDKDSGSFVVPVASCLWKVAGLFFASAGARLQ